MKLYVEGAMPSVEHLLSEKVADEFKKAVVAGDAKALIRLFRPDGTINYQFNNEGKRTTPLLFAAENGSAETFKLLLRLGASVPESDEENKLLRAALRGSKHENVTLLLEKGASCSQGDNSVLFEKTSESCLRALLNYICAQQQQHLHPFVKIAIKKIGFSEDIDNFKVVLEKITDDKDLNELLVWAVEHDFSQVCELLLNKINKVDREDLLFLAVEKKAPNAIEALCESKRINVNLQLDRTIVDSHEKTTKTTLSALMYAIIIKRYVEAISICKYASDEVKVNERNTAFGTPLLRAIDRVHTLRRELIDTLLSVETLDVTFCDAQGFSPLHDAMAAADLETLRIILSRISGEVSLNPTIIAQAVANDQNYAPILQEFIKHPKANINMIYGTQTLLNFAVLAENVELVMQLLSRLDVDVNINIASMKAVFRKNKKILMAFILHDGVDISFFVRINMVEEFQGMDVQRVIKSHALLDQPSVVYEGKPLVFRDFILQSYRLCPLVLENRISRMISRYQHGFVEPGYVQQNLALVRALLNFPSCDEAFAQLCRNLGEFIFVHVGAGQFENRFELAVLFLLRAQNETNPIIISSLLKLADVPDALDKNRPLTELLTDSTIRPVLLKSLVKAYHYRICGLIEKPAVCVEDVEVYYEDNPDPLLLMWDITRWYASEQAITSHSAEQEISNIVDLYEKFVARQQVIADAKVASSSSNFNVKELASQLARTLSDAVAATQMPSIGDADPALNNDIGNP